MATPFRIEVPVGDTGLLGMKQNDDAAAKVSELLQRDLEKHHVFFNASGYHNHIPHHLLSLYALGSGPQFLQAAYDNNASYQIKAQGPRSKVLEELQEDYSKATAYLGKGKHYADFLRFFQGEIEKRGCQEVLKEYLFKENEQSKDLFARLYSGFLHPMIQLMYGVEWQQPALVAEGLAQAAVHANSLGDVLAKTEAASRTNSSAGQRTLAELMEGIHSPGNEKLAGGASWDDINRIYDGVLVRAPNEAIEYTSQVRVQAEELDERTAEMFHTVAWLVAAAAFNPPHIPKFDFFFIHHLNSAPIFLSFNQEPWIPVEMKVRLLEYKMRMDIIQYIARGLPPLNTDAIRAYTPRDKALVSQPEDLLPRFYGVPDDGHTIKVVRALLIAQRLSKKYADRPWIRIVDDDMWLKMHYMLLDSVEGTDERWVRSAGFEEAWETIPKVEA